MENEREWEHLIATIGAPYGQSTQLAAVFNKARQRASVLAALTGSVNAVGHGIWLNPDQEADLQDKCRTLFDRRIRTPDVELDEANTFSYAPGRGVRHGLDQFDDWLQQSGSGHRLVAVTTGASFSLSILCPENSTATLIQALANCDLAASLHQLNSATSAPLADAALADLPPAPPHLAGTDLSPAAAELPPPPAAPIEPGPAVQDLPPPPAQPADPAPEAAELALQPTASIEPGPALADLPAPPGDPTLPPPPADPALPPPPAPPGDPTLPPPPTDPGLPPPPGDPTLPPPPADPGLPPPPETDLLPWQQTNDAAVPGARLPSVAGLGERLRQKREEDE